jgi:hypothetical protein
MSVFKLIKGSWVEISKNQGDVVQAFIFYKNGIERDVLYPESRKKSNHHFYLKKRGAAAEKYYTAREPACAVPDQYRQPMATTPE